jgi:DNA-binding transcriptional LysR family regulator
VSNALWRADSYATRNNRFMEVQQARVFLAVAEELHFARAAERLHLSQPPVTRAIQQLERSLGVALFDRTTRTVRLTAAGEALVPPARELLEVADRAAAVVASVGQGEFGRVRIAFAGASTHVIVGLLAREVRRRYPGIDIELSSQNYAQPAMARVLRGEMDIALGRWDFLPATIDSRLVARERLVLAVPIGHRLAGETSVRIADVAEEPFIALTSEASSVLNDRLVRLSHTAGFDAEIVQIAPDSWTAIALVAAEIGVSLTLSTVAENTLTPRIAFVPVEDATLPIELRMAWRSDADRTAAIDTVLRLAETVLPSPRV